MTCFSYIQCLKSRRIKLSTVLSSFMLCIILEGTEGKREQLPWTPAGIQNQQKIPLSSCSVSCWWLPTQMHTPATTLACLQYALKEKLSPSISVLLSSHPHPFASFWAFMHVSLWQWLGFFTAQVKQNPELWANSWEQPESAYSCLQCHSAGHRIEEFGNSFGNPQGGICSWCHRTPTLGTSITLTSCTQLAFKSLQIC